MTQLRTGLIRRRLPAAPDFRRVPPQEWDFSFDVDAIRAAYSTTTIGDAVSDDVVRDAERLLAGEFPMFGGDWVELGWPFDWLTNPTSGSRYPMAHWTTISDDDPTRGDIKDVWELSRFRPTFLLARAFVITTDSPYPESWWTAVESWAAANPPNTGPNWRCAQETSLRAIAWCFGLSAFAAHPATTPERRLLLERLLGASVRRVSVTLPYALSQRNNHAISELVFLLSMPGPQPRRLARLLRESLDDQFMSDGSYGQQSLIYQRLAVQTLKWLLTVQPQLDLRLRGAITDRLRASALFLQRCVDPVSGQLANYGPNDGTNLLALANADHLDGRPTLELLGVNTGDLRAMEPTLWLRTMDEQGRTGQRDARTTYATLRGPNSLLVSRTGALRRRAADADQQAVELFVDGRRVVIDPGTFRYSGSGVWRSPFVGLDLHSVARPNDMPAMRSVGRFLREPVAPADVVAHEFLGEREVLVTTRTDGPTTIVRGVIRDADRYAVVDHIVGGDGTVRWNLAASLALDLSDASLSARDAAVEAELDTPAGANVYDRSDALPASGWWSPTYAARAACHAIEIALPAGATVLARFTPRGGAHLDRAEVERTVSPLIERAFEGRSSS